MVKFKRGQCLKCVDLGRVALHAPFVENKRPLVTEHRIRRVLVYRP